MSFSDEEIVNQRLLAYFGASPDGLHPYFRLVWSEGLMEIRKGDYGIFLPNGLKIAEEKDVIKPCRKYEFVKDRWILEVYCPEQQVGNPEIVAMDGYESLFVFQDKKGNYLKPYWWAVKFACDRYIAATSGEIEKRTEAMDLAAEEEAKDKEVAKFVEYLENESSDMMNKFRYQEAVIIHKES